MKIPSKEINYIPINKGHFELDTIERHNAFHSVLAEGWRKQYLKYRRLWAELPKNRELRDYPLLVDLELSSRCNLKCPMCYTISEDFQRNVKTSFMDFTLFQKIIDEIAGKVYAVRLSLRGEPTLHKNLIGAIRYAKQCGIGEVSFLTNGSRMSPEYTSELISAGVDWITVSVDGTDDMYEKIRKPLIFKETIEKLNQIKGIKNRIGCKKPVVKVQGIWPAIRINPEKYYNILAPCTDLIAYNPLIDYLKKDKNIIYEKKFSCPQLYQRLVIAADGDILMCANDEDSEVIVGNADRQEIHEVWHGDEMNRIRAHHNQKNGFLNIGPCIRCYYPRKTVLDETATVNNRTIWIENYTNRKQVIGE